MNLQKSNDNVWTATVEQSESNIYEIYIKAYNVSGFATETSTTLYYDVNLIFDRTIKDLFEKTNKSFYNATDLNRVESATYYIERLLQIYSYFNNNLIYKTNWLMSDFPSETEMRRYLSNIQELINAFYLKLDSPSLPNDMNLLTIEEANAIEKILYDLKKLIENMVSEFKFCNEFFSGEV